MQSIVLSLFTNRKIEKNFKKEFLEKKHEWRFATKFLIENS